MLEQALPVARLSENDAPQGVERTAARPRDDARPLTPVTYAKPTFLRLATGFVYFYFGFLKLFPDLSPAELLAAETVMRLTLHHMDASSALWWLAVMEVAIGVCFFLNYKLHWVFLVYLGHQAMTFLPLVLLPELTFKFVPFAPTIEGQYILKNVILVAAGWTVMMPMVREKHGARWERVVATWRRGAAK